MRLPVLLAATALALSACSGGTPDAQPTAEADSTGGKPQLALTPTCYGACTSPSPLGLPELVVYADGRVVAVDRSGGRPVLRSGRVDADRLARLQASAVAAGLVDGERSTLALTGPGPAAGVGTVVTVRLRSALTRLEVPYLDAAGPRPERYADSTRYTRVVSLVKALREVAAGATQAAPARSHVVQARPVRPQRGAQPRPWPGPPLGALPLVEGDLRCGVLTGTDQAAAAAAVEASGAPVTYADRGRTWVVVGRPMLPHEQTCGDVRDTALGARAAGPRFPGDRRA